MRSGPQAAQLIQASQMYAQYSLGRLYETGQGVTQDMTQAAGWYVRASDLGHPKAAMKLAYLFRDGGPGLKPDGRLAVTYFEKAGHGAALNEIGLMYLEGHCGHPQCQDRPTGSRRRRRKAAPRPNTISACCSRPAIPASRDYLQAMDHFQTAANAKDGPSMLALGQLYAEGKGVPKDLVQAHTWFDLATANGTPEGAARAAAIEASMTPTEIVQAKAAAATWHAAATTMPARPEHRDRRDAASGRARCRTGARETRTGTCRRGPAPAPQPAPRLPAAGATRCRAPEPARNPRRRLRPSRTELAPAQPADRRHRPIRTGARCRRPSPLLPRLRCRAPDPRRRPQRPQSQRPTAAGIAAGAVDRTDHRPSPCGTDRHPAACSCSRHRNRRRPLRCRRGGLQRARTGLMTHRRHRCSAFDGSETAAATYPRTGAGSVGRRR